MTSPITQAIKAVAVATHGANKKIGNTAELATDDKTTLVAAINELHANSGGVDTEQVNQLIKAKIDELIGGASSAFDTLKEIEDALTSSQNGATGEILTQVGDLKNRVQALESYVGKDDDLVNIINTALNTGV